MPRTGNLTLGFSENRGTTYKYTYDHNNRLIEVEDDSTSTRKAKLAYDALGRPNEVINDTLTTTTRYYYDGGFSGGTIERPGIQKLMEDIEAGKIDCVVVYKVDRLSRSCSDDGHV